MRKAGQWRTAHGVEQINLHGGVGDMVLAPDDMGNPHIRVVHHRGKRIQRRAVGADQHGVRDGAELNVPAPQHQIVPGGVAVGELEPPVRALAVGLRRGALLRRHGQRGAVIHRRQLALHQRGALGRQLVLILKTRIQPPGGLQLFGDLLIPCGALGLFRRLVPGNAEPVQVVDNALLILRPAALGIGIVQPEEKLPPLMPGEQEIHQSGAGVADMQIPRGAGREANFCHQRGLNHSAPGVKLPGASPLDPSRGCHPLPPWPGLMPGPH